MTSSNDCGGGRKLLMSAEHLCLKLFICEENMSGLSKSSLSPNLQIVLHSNHGMIHCDIVCTAAKCLIQFLTAQHISEDRRVSSFFVPDTITVSAK